jgi:hypothetical protein
MTGSIASIGRGRGGVKEKRAARGRSFPKIPAIYAVSGRNTPGRERKGAAGKIVSPPRKQGLKSIPCLRVGLRKMFPHLMICVKGINCGLVSTVVVGPGLPGMVLQIGYGVD